MHWYLHFDSGRLCHADCLEKYPAPGRLRTMPPRPISSNWAISYQAAFISDERGRNYFEIPEYNLQEQRKAKPPSGSTKFEELQCFECHKSPTPAHKERKGRFHH
jgi:hypothetical protein